MHVLVRQWELHLEGCHSLKEKRALLKPLTAALRRHYPARHRLVLYEASQFPVSEPVVMGIRLSALPVTPVLPMTTIYVPPLQSRSLDPRIMEWFDDG